MYCSQCGGRVVAEAQLCSMCGTRFVPDEAPGPGVPLGETRGGPSADAGEAAVDAPIPATCGVEGWLLVFCAGVLILGPMKTFVFLAYEWRLLESLLADPALNAALTLETLGLLAFTLYGSAVGFALWYGNPKGRTVALRYLLVRAFGVAAIEVAAAMLATDWRLDALPAAMGLMMATNVSIQLVTCLVWWPYFKFSERVRHTYTDGSHATVFCVSVAGKSCAGSPEASRT